MQGSRCVCSYVSEFPIALLHLPMMDVVFICPLIAASIQHMSRSFFPERSCFADRDPSFPQPSCVRPIKQAVRDWLELMTVVLVYKYRRTLFCSPFLLPYKELLKFVRELFDRGVPSRVPDGCDSHVCRTAFPFHLSKVPGR